MWRYPVNVIIMKNRPPTLNVALDDKASFYKLVKLVFNQALNLVLDSLQIVCVSLKSFTIISM